MTLPGQMSSRGALMFPSIENVTFVAQQADTRCYCAGAGTGTGGGTTTIMVVTG